MARIWTCGFEEVFSGLNATFLNTTFDNITTQGTVGIELVSSGGVVHGGVRAANFTGNASAYLTKSLATNFTTGRTFYFRMYFYFKALGAANTSQAIARAVGATGATPVIWGARFTPSTAKMALRVDAASTTDVVGTITYQIATWYRLEVAFTIEAAGTNNCILRTYAGDSNTILETIQSTNNVTVDCNYFEIGNRSGGDISGGGQSFVVDDVAINDNTGTVCNSLCGPGKIVLKTPSSLDTNAGSSWSVVGGGTDAAAIDDVLTGAPDNATTYVKSSGAGDEAEKMFLNSTNPLDAVDGNGTVLDFAMVFGVGPTTGGTTLIRAWDGTNVFNSPSLTLPAINSWTRTTTNNTLPVYLAGKTMSAINAIEVGYTAHSGVNIEKRVTALWGNFEYIPNVLIPVASSGTLTFNFEAAPGLPVSAQVTSNQESTAKTVANIAISNQEARSSLTPVSQQLTSNQEFTKKVLNQL